MITSLARLLGRKIYLKKIIVYVKIKITKYYEVFMKIKDGFILQRVGSSYLAVAVGDRADSFKAMIRLNDTGAFLWGLLTEDKGREEAIELFMNEYEIPRELAEADFDAFCLKLTEGGLLDD